MVRLLGLLCAAVVLLGVQAAMADIVWSVGPSGPSEPILTVPFNGPDDQWELLEGTHVQYDNKQGPLIKDFIVPSGGFDRGVYYIDEFFTVYAPPDWADWEMAITSGNAKFAWVDDDILYINGVEVPNLPAISDWHTELAYFFDPALTDGTTIELSVGIYLPRSLPEGSIITIDQYPTVPEPSIFVALAGLVPVGLAGCVWRRKRASV
jgi:hypothetical protein